MKVPTHGGLGQWDEACVGPASDPVLVAVAHPCAGGQVFATNVSTS